MSRKPILLILAMLGSLLDGQDRKITPVGSARRLAIVVGNSTYPWKPLRNAVNDARAISAKLGEVGFSREHVFYGENLNNVEFRRLRRQFLQALRAGDVALVYFAGHGVEVKGTNHLLPVDFPSNATELQAPDEAIAAQELLARMVETGAQVRLMILDACRDNPLPSGRSGQRGLGSMERVAGEGTLIVFATEAGRTASDNPSGPRGLFTTFLLREIGQPGQTVDTMVKQVARAVRDASNRQQVPAIYGLLLEDFSFVPSKPGAVPAAPSLDLDLERYTAVKDSRDPAQLEAVAAQLQRRDLAQVLRDRARTLRSMAAPVVERAPETTTRPEPFRAGDTRVNPTESRII
ncbi:MAG: caspase family protein [Bryobacteraceae bacterium]|nr:caspase family protein [Bryobacteraceae bacterium]